VTGALSRLDPSGAALYEAKLAQFRSRLESKMVEWEGKLAPYKGQQVVAYHNTWQYFTRRFGLRSDLFLEPKPGIPPTPAHLAGVVARMRADRVRVIVVEPFQSRKTAERVAAQVGAVVVDAAQYPGGVKGTESDYVGLLEELVQSMSRALSRR
jgi:ABC-type Zn uptake system ZnuABC Zn-binding protein ZnuA